jgi:hypothetical protein
VEFARLQRIRRTKANADQVNEIIEAGDFLTHRPGVSQNGSRAGSTVDLMPQ